MPLHRQTRRLVRIFSILGLSLSAALVLVYGLLRGDWLAGLLAGITLAMSMLPQKFLLILSRRSATIETLGSATVLCTDKTGTLTVNKMALAELCVASTAGLQSWTAEGQALPT